MAKPVVGPKGQFYADPQPSPDETAFRQDNTSAVYYNSAYYRAHKSQVQPIPPRHNALPLSLADFLPPATVTAIEGAGKISFHATGDTGAAKVTRSQTAATAIQHQAHVADAMAADVQKGGDTGAAFLFLLGDLIYNFGEAQYYYDQFYEPYRAYDRPIFAIPGNHDGVVFGASSSAPQVPSLQAFLANFCAAAPGRSPDAGTLMRSVMTQPGVYFTVDAPFVSVIGLYSNVLEGPGVISSQGNHFPNVGGDQLTFLKSELQRLKPQRAAHQRAVVIAIHHPPISADALHGGSTGTQADLDACCTAAGLWPDLVLSGHAHLYQRFTRTAPTGQETPYLVCGAGGFSATPPMAKTPPAGTTVGNDRIDVDPIVKFGYLTVETDAKTLSVAFTVSDVNGQTVKDTVSVDLVAGKVRSGTAGAIGKGPKPAPPKPPAAKPAKSKASSRRKPTGKPPKPKASGGRKPAAKRRG